MVAKAVATDAAGSASNWRVAILSVGLWAVLGGSALFSGGLDNVHAKTMEEGNLLAVEPPSSSCPNDEPDEGASHAACPDVNGTVKEGQTLIATPGTWSGTPEIDFAYQWQRCSSNSASSCTDIGSETLADYTVTEPEGVFGFRFRVKVTATNAPATFDQVVRYSALTAAAITAVGIAGDDQVWPPGIEVVGEPDATHPDVGDTLYAADGHSPEPPASDAFFDPPSTFALSFQWLRCSATTGTGCEPIAGASSRAYQLVTADGNRSLRVRVIGRNIAGARVLRSDNSYDVAPAPDAPIPPDALAPPPALIGGPDGGVAADLTAPRITALKLTNKRFAPGSKRTPIAAARRAPRGTTFQFRLSEPATITIELTRLLTGRKVGRSCKPRTRKNRSRPKCIHTRPAGKLTRRGQPVGATSVAFSGRLGNSRLTTGPYRAALVATDAAGNRSPTATVGFTIIKR
jgi:hypothetical protein